MAQAETGDGEEDRDRATGRSPIMVNWAAPETINTGEAVASQGEKPASTARTP
jgi:hypothetical protein